MNVLNTLPDSRHQKTSPHTLATTLRNSPHLHALSEFFLATRKGDTKQLLVTFLLSLLLVIPTGTLLLAQGLNNASDNLKLARRITMFLPADNSSNSGTLAATLRQNFRVEGVSEVTMGGAGTATGPVILELTPIPGLARDSVIELADHIRTLPGIDFVDLNTERLHKIDSAFSVLTLMAKLSNVLALIVAALFTLLVSRRDIYNNQNDINLMRQIGATNTELRRPYFYRSLALGFLAGLLSIVTVATITAVTAKYTDLSSIGTLIPSKPSMAQLTLFLAIVSAAGLVATARTFTKILHK